MIGLVGRRGILEIGTSGAQKRERNSVWPGAISTKEMVSIRVVRKENLKVCMSGDGEKWIRIHEKKQEF